MEYAHTPFFRAWKLIGSLPPKTAPADFPTATLREWTDSEVVYYQEIFWIIRGDVRAFFRETSGDEFVACKVFLLLLLRREAYHGGMCGFPGLTDGDSADYLKFQQQVRSLLYCRDHGIREPDIDICNPGDYDRNLERLAALGIPHGFFTSDFFYCKPW